MRIDITPLILTYNEAQAPLAAAGFLLTVNCYQGIAADTAATTAPPGGQWSDVSLSASHPPSFDVKAF